MSVGAIKIPKARLRQGGKKGGGGVDEWGNRGKMKLRSRQKGMKRRPIKRFRL